MPITLHYSTFLALINSELNLGDSNRYGTIIGKRILSLTEDQESDRHLVVTYTDGLPWTEPVQVYYEFDEETMSLIES